MPRVNIKGGVWRNTEDEILKAAVMKYGMTQWSRIASLLHRKSAKQCKARWNEWLDPSIKKTEWSRDEEEKLLHLAKLLPTQWRTIAPLVGRTAAQCLEHYELLLDKATRGLEGDDGGEDGELGLHARARQLKPGEIDPAPETKPARPDPVDMDEDELEMLSEARARLANTQGKKAKRKLREKQLSEAKRLASLQKRREMKQAGLLSNKMSSFARKKLAFMDYNSEIPFERKPVRGFHDTSQEKTEKPEFDFKRLRRSDMEPELRSQTEERKRKEDAMKLRELREKDMAEYLRRQESQTKQPTRKRAKLVLPQPLVTDQELDNVVKLGIASAEARKFDGSVSDRLIGEYDELGGMETPMVGEEGASGGMTPGGMTPGRKAAMMRAPQAKGENNLMKQAQNLLAMDAAKTPLAGGVNTPMHDISNEKEVVQTPNVVFGKTPKRGNDENEKDDKQLPEATPARDALSINKPGNEFLFDDEADDFLGGDAGDLANQLENLPEPKNDFEIIVPEETKEEEATAMDDEEDAEILREREVEDMEETILKQKEANEKERLEKLSRRHMPVKMGLPRPSIINEKVLRPAKTDYSKLDNHAYVEEIIKQEMLKMMHYDALNYPCDNQVVSTDAKGRTKRKGILPPAAHEKYLKAVPYEDITPEEYASAKDLINEEMERLKAVSDHGEFDYTHVHTECRDQLLFLPSQTRWTRNSIATRRDKLESNQVRLETNKNMMTKQAKQAAKFEKKLKVLTDGYRSRNEQLSKDLKETGENIIQTQRDTLVFEKLSKVERRNGDERVKDAQKLYQDQLTRHLELQKEFDDLTHQLKTIFKEAEEHNKAVIAARQAQAKKDLDIAENTTIKLLPETEDNTVEEVMIENEVD